MAFTPGSRGPPSAPSDLTAIPTSTSTIDLFWNDNSDNEDSFQVQISTDGGPFEDLGSVPSNSIGGTASGLEPGTTYTFRVRAHSAADGYSAFSPAATATTFSSGACDPNAGTLCLNGGRFAVRASYTTATGDSGEGFGVEMTEDTGYFWFFNRNNVEVMVKVLDGCGFNDKIWVFAGGLTDLGVIITVEDTTRGNTWTDTSPLGRSFETITEYIGSAM